MALRAGRRRAGVVHRRERDPVAGFTSFPPAQRPYAPSGGSTPCAGRIVAGDEAHVRLVGEGRGTPAPDPPAGRAFGPSGTLEGGATRGCFASLCVS
jgi:hypothetical protein